VFPFGNIVTIFTSPVAGGFYFHGLTSSIALVVPLFRQFFKTIGVIDASRESATKVSVSSSPACVSPTSLLGSDE
jgi:hypothetical protein